MTWPMSSVENPAQLVAHQTELLVFARLLVNLIMSRDLRVVAQQAVAEDAALGRMQGPSGRPPSSGSGSGSRTPVVCGGSPVRRCSSAVPSASVTSPLGRKLNVPPGWQSPLFR